MSDISKEKSKSVQNVSDIDTDVKKNNGSKAADIISTAATIVLSIAILVGAVLFSVNTSPNKSIFGYRYYTVLTPSMSPIYEVGDIIFVHIASAKEIDVGDVITFNPSADNDAYLTHRVFEKYDDYEGTGVTCFKTKGDANDSEDTFLIDASRVIGKVQGHVPKLGYLIRFFQLRWYFVVPIVVMLIVFIALLKMYFNDDEDEDSDSGKDEEKSTSKNSSENEN